MVCFFFFLPTAFADTLRKTRWLVATSDMAQKPEQELRPTMLAQGSTGSGHQPIRPVQRQITGLL